MMADTRADAGAKARNPKQAAIEMVFALPLILAGSYPVGHLRDWSLRLELYTYRMPTSDYFSGDFHGIGGFAPTNFVVCSISAAAPLLAALWLFNRKAY